MASEQGTRREDALCSRSCDGLREPSAEHEDVKVHVDPVLFAVARLTVLVECKERAQ